VAVVDTTHCLYYADVPNPILRDLGTLASLSYKAMENVQKEHMTTFHKRLPVCDPTLDLKFSNKYKFVTTWILTQKWWLKNYNYSSLCKWTTSRRFLGSRNGTSPRFSRKLRNFPRSSCRIPFLKNGFTRQHFWFQLPHLFILIIHWYSFYTFSLGM
jgi:hypothetical protein